MPFRDVLDSTFDDVIRIDYIALGGTEALLNGRTLDVPFTFIALCHALAGGLPREVIRVGQRLFDLTDTTEKTDMRSLC